ncbi:MAG: hypothetical protein ACE14L_12325 [Terriglobales bacterium]
MKAVFAALVLLPCLCFAGDEITVHCGEHPALMRDSAGKVVWLSPAELEARIVKKVPVQKPAVAGLNYSGVVSIKVMINTTGDVVCMWDAAGSPVVLANAVVAAQQWKFKPLTKKGAPAEYVGTLKVSVSTR